jgi:hypothetical protein
MFSSGFHLTYCTNIHPGESWDAVFANLQQYVPEIKRAVAPAAPFGIGLRLSGHASRELLENDGNLAAFQAWLSREDCYVFTINGFPHGGFHGEAVKDNVHSPDWTTRERLTYTLRLFEILVRLLPEGVDGGISTSPLSYRHWHREPAGMERCMRKSALQLAEVAARLHELGEQNGKELHLDIEPEPDGVLENVQEVIDYYRNWLIPQGSRYLGRRLGFSTSAAEECLRKHIRLCYDVCHFAIVHEEPERAFAALAREGIRIGKVQLSAALKLDMPADPGDAQTAAQLLQPFAESTYLHQVVARDQWGRTRSYPDLTEALDMRKRAKGRGLEEWRIHFHVPVFLPSYGALASTQGDILKVLRCLRKEALCRHLEVETYTWNVLPEPVQLDLTDAIIREIQWVMQSMDSQQRSAASPSVARL